VKGSNLQNRTLNRECPHRRAAAIDEKILALPGLLRAWHRHPKLVVQPRRYGGDGDSDGGGLLVRHVLWDFESQAFFHHAVLAECAVFWLRQVGSVRDATDTVADFVVFGDFRSEGDDCADYVASHRHSRGSEDGDFDVLPAIVVNWTVQRPTVV
jgi:hypothetical protein